MHPAGIVVEVAVQRGQQLQLIPPTAGFAPEAHPSLVPCAGHDGVLALGTIEAEKLSRQVVGVGHAHRHNDMSSTDIQRLGETFLHPELFQRHLAAAFHLLLELTSLLGLFLHGCLYAAMLELNLSADAPSAAKVVANHNNRVRQVETRIGRRITIAIGMRVAKNVV